MSYNGHQSNYEGGAGDGLTREARRRFDQLAHSPTFPNDILGGLWTKSAKRRVCSSAAMFMADRSPRGVGSTGKGR